MFKRIAAVGFVATALVMLTEVAANAAASGRTWV